MEILRECGVVAPRTPLLRGFLCLECNPRPSSRLPWLVIAVVDALDTCVDTRAFRSGVLRCCTMARLLRMWSVLCHVSRRTAAATHLAGCPSLSAAMLLPVVPFVLSGRPRGHTDACRPSAARMAPTSPCLVPEKNFRTGGRLSRSAPSTRSCVALTERNQLFLTGRQKG